MHTGLTVLTFDKIQEETKKKQIFEDNIEILQANGYKEILEYQRLVKDFLDKACNLAIMKSLMEEVGREEAEFFLITDLLDTVIRPVFTGDRPPLMSKEDYDNMRVDMYTDLYNKYINRKR